MQPDAGEAIQLINTMNWLRDAGLLGMLLLFIWGGYKKVWCWGRELEDRDKRIEKLEQNIERWQAVAHQSLPMLERTVDTLSKK
jgi:hypothetical protein